MGGLASAAAPATTAASLVADAYMPVPADVAAAPADVTAAVGPVSCMHLISRDMNMYELLYGLVFTTCGCR